PHLFQGHVPALARYPQPLGDGRHQSGAHPGRYRRHDPQYRYGGACGVCWPVARRSGPAQRQADRRPEVRHAGGRLSRRRLLFPTLGVSMSVRLAINPITWVNDDLPSLGAGTSLDTILSETRQAGFAGTEMSFEFPKTSKELGPLLKKYDLVLTSGWY